MAVEIGRYRAVLFWFTLMMQRRQLLQQRLQHFSQFPLSCHNMTRLPLAVEKVSLPCYCCFREPLQLLTWKTASRLLLLLANAGGRLSRRDERLDQ